MTNGARPSHDPQEILERLYQEILALKPAGLRRLRRKAATEGEAARINDSADPVAPEVLCDAIRSPAFAEAVEAGHDGGRLVSAASHYGLTPVVRLLLESGCPADWLDTAKRTPLHFAALGSLGDHSVEIALDLLAAGAEVDPQDQSGRTPLLEACAAGDLDMVDVLTEAGANPRHTAGGESPAWVAQGKDREQILRCLRRHARDRPAVRFGKASDSAPPGFGAERWLRALPGDGRVLAIQGAVSHVAARLSRAGLIHQLKADDAPAPRLDSGAFLVELAGSPWTLVHAFGFAPDAPRCSAVCPHRVVELAFHDTSGFLSLKQWRQGRLYEAVSWSPDDGVCFHSEERATPPWVRQRSRPGRDPAHHEWQLAQALDELELEVPNHFLHHDGLDAQLRLLDVPRARVAAVAFVSSDVPM